MGGYILVDATGLNLNSSSKQTVTGLYDRAKAAMATGKPCFVVNCNMSGMPVTPVSVAAWDEGDSGIIATGHVLRVLIEEDGVTVTNLVAG